MMGAILGVIIIIGSGIVGTILNVHYCIEGAPFYWALGLVCGGLGMGLVLCGIGGY